MTLDVHNSEAFAGDSYSPPQVSVEGIFLKPSITTLNSQATGDAATVLVARRSGGRVKLFDKVLDVVETETTLIDTTTAAVEYKQGTLVFALGKAVYFTLVAFRQGMAGGISFAYVPGDIAALADAEPATFDEVVDFLELDERQSVVILGDIRYSRSADTVIDVAVSHKRRPAWVDEDNKVGVLVDAADQSGLGSELWGYVDMHVDLASLSAKSAGQLYIDGLALPQLPYGGYLGAPQWITTVVGAGAGADLTVLLNIDGVPVTGGGSLNPTITNVNTIPTTLNGTAPTGAHKFKGASAGLDLELDVKTTVFSSGSGRIRVPIYKYVDSQAGF